MGQVPDLEVAAQFGCSDSSVGMRRRQLGIAACARRRETTVQQPAAPFWSPAREALLGTMTDQEVAERLGCSHHTVWARRQHLGIPCFGRNGPPIPERQHQGARPNQAQHDRVARLRAEGLSITEIAQRVGRTRQAVYALLKASGDTTRLPPATIWPPAKNALLGTATDQELATQFGCSRGAVQQR